MKAKMTKTQITKELKEAKAEVQAAIDLRTNSTCVVFQCWKNRVEELEKALKK